MADLIVISKPDLVSEHQLEAFEARLQALNLTARNITRRSRVVATGAFGPNGIRQKHQTYDQVMAGFWMGNARAQTRLPNPLQNLSGLNTKR